MDNEDRKKDDGMAMRGYDPVESNARVHDTNGRKNVRRDRIKNVLGLTIPESISTDGDSVS